VILAVLGVLVAAVVGDGDDVRKSTLVGPSGEVYEASGDGAWVRRREGGVAADVTGAARVGGELIVAGRADPLYRDRKGTWFALRLGEEGKTVMARGPGTAVAIGKSVLVPDKKGWKRVGNLPGKVVSLWARGGDVWASTDTALYHLTGKSFSKVKKSKPGTLAGGTPWAVTDAGLVDLDGKRTVKAELGGAAVTVVAAGGAPGDDELTVVVESGGSLVLARTEKRALVKVDTVPGTGAIAALVVDDGGDVLVAFADGTVALRRGGAWTTGAVADDLPKARKGSAAAHTR
jgi:hypothetical protein